jgi:hypothetical protein
MKHQEVIDLNHKLKKVKNLKGAAINYAIKKNLKNLVPEIEVYQEEENELLEVQKEFTEESNALWKEYATGEDGEVKTKTEEGVVMFDVPLSKRKELEKKLEDLREKHKEALDKVKEMWSVLEKSRAEGDSDFKIFTIKKEAIPDDISTEDMDLIFNLIEE